jgi:hypothetical protein
MFPIVLVIWEDARTQDGGPWVGREVEYKPYLVHQVGFLIKDSPEGIIISQAVAPEALGVPDQIPRGMIRSLKYLRKNYKLD